METRWHLREADFFEGLPTEMAEFISLSARRQVRANEFIFSEGSPANSAYYLATGAVRIFRTNVWGKECVAFTRLAGEMFGLAEVVGKGAKKRECNAQALGSCQLYEIAKGDLDHFLSRHYVLANRVMDVLGRRIRYLCEQIENLMVDDVTTRLLKLLLYLSYRQMTGVGVPSDPVTVPVRLTQEQIAAAIGSCQQTVSETLQRLERDGIIEINRRQITVLKPAEIMGSLGA